MRCQVCEKARSKYTCPRCGIKTCCLDCVRLHKTRSSCNGQRNMSGYVAKAEMSNLTLLSDYRFLEQVDRNIEHLSRKRLARRPNTRQSFLHQNLVKIAKDYDIDLRFLPAEFSKHKSNRTRFEKRPDATFILWSVEFLFPACEASFILFPVHQTRQLSQVVQDLFDPAKTSADFYFKVKAMRTSALKGFLSHAGKRVPVNLDDDLTTVLKYRTVFEFPTIILEQNTEN